ncbi:rRNA biogenesis protein RRP5 OS=Saccharomyces cerevisiae (strain ATCC 204508 / S288c) GN=RRP5 PE=1 SV=1 [Rhizoctonia solani AG-1 IB]|uniref:Protein RRP5 homolog n=1 Tax=Thanatephorus cucumeris (strain AG1-IB / isolate 7/3/14) TaxID=1108050 RepID=A0A0B7FK08_THACB|nr:rRNA biogenesis protein RRP5 OS=Saccharomyces cerevisiae (strain ATCC 204508 / S288c) GN=RRP5 PE=1 SV=1 [Rhizoctonia solani AG-1 IB]
MAPQKRNRDSIDQPMPSTSLLKAEKSKKTKRSHEPGSYDAQAAPAGKKVKFGEDGNSKDVSQRPSTLLSEEVDFPRGGGVTLEELNKSSNDSAMEVDGQPAVKKPRKRAEKGKKDKKGKQKTDTAADAKSDTARVEHLNYKRLESGQKLLGQITSILPLALIVSLPNQLMGHVPIVNISSQLTSRLEATPSNPSESGDEEDEEEDDGVPSLSQMFKPGDYVSCTVKQVRPVSSTIDFGAKPRDEEEKAARRVELSIRPSDVNVGVGAGDLRTGFNISGAIQSVEDHGYIVDLGITDVSGFIPYKDKSKSDAKRLSVGQVVSSTVVKLSENKRLCTLSTKSDAIHSASLTEATSAHALLPGTLVSALVTAVVPSGLNLQVLGYFGGTIELFHLPGGTDDIKEGDKVKARILWDIPGSSPPRFALSLLPHVIKLTSASAQPTPIQESKKSKKKAEVVSEDTPTLREAYPVGMLLEAVKVTRVESEWGLVCQVTEGVGAFVHISQISDSLVPQLSSASGAWRLGSSHRARVIGHHALDGLLLLSFKPSVLELEYMQVADVEVGKTLKGTIVRLRESGLVVALSDKVTGLVTPQHYADIKLKHPERKFKESTTIKCKVLSVNPERSRVLLTLKKSLLDSTLPILGTFEDAKVGIVTPGVIQRIEERFVILEYYGGVKALVPLNELTDTQVPSTSGLFNIGQVVKSRITSIDKEKHRLTASIRQAAPSFQGPVDVSKVEVGSTVSGAVSAIHDENVVLSLDDPEGGRALLSVSNLANARGTTVPQLRSSLEQGERVENLSVISVNSEKALVIVSAAKPKEKAKPKTGISSSLRIDALEEGQIVSGRITQTMGTGTGVRLSGHVVGRLHTTDVADDYTGSLAAPPAEGSVVEVAIVRVDKNLKRVDVSMRKSRLEPSSKHKVVDREITNIEELKVGEKVRGIVKSVVQHGIFVMIGRDLDARIQIKELFDEYVKDWQSRFSIGQVVDTRVLATNPETNQIELTMRSGDINKLLKHTIGLSDFKVGQKIEGRIKRVADFGIFVEIAGTKISGLCHKSEISDSKKANVGEALKSFREDDPIKAVILSIDTAARKISFGIKPSYFDDEDFVMKDASQDEDGSDAEEVEGENEDQVEETEEEEAEESEAEEGSEDEDSDEELADAIAEVTLPEETVAVSKTISSSKDAPTLSLSGGFNWSGQNEERTNGGASESEESASEEEDSTKKSKKKKKRAILKDMTADLHTKVPESTADFERVLLGSPNSSYLWIQYMSFQLQLSEIDKAREVGRRALQTINYREEQEKLNVWIALLNLENQFGTEESLETLFKDAARHNDSKTIHLRMAAIFDESEKTQKAEEQYARTAKKFSQSSKAWTLFGEHYLKAGKLEESRKLLARSLLSLPQRKHLKTISTFARMEYKLGDPERGKTIFEGIVESHPKRNDLWSMYIDMEASQGNAQSVRNIFNRALARKLAAKQAKFYFKKWLEIEKRIGDDAGAEGVKEKAMAWMQSHSSSNEES